MIVGMDMIRTGRDWTYEALDAYWRDHHGSLAARAPGLQEYWLNSVTDCLELESESERGPDDLNGLSHSGPTAGKTGDRAFVSPAGQATMAYAKLFLGQITACVVDEQEMIGGSS